MITPIEKAQATSVPSLDYNEKKVKAGTAMLIAYANLRNTDPETIYETMEALSDSSYRECSTGFHMSVNPSETDTCSERQVLDFIKNLMIELGYGKQPYVVYKHFDIDREHYHIVSNRIDVKTHRKIKDSNERYKAIAFIKKNSKRYGITLGKQEETEMFQKNPKSLNITYASAAFNPHSKTPLQEQVLTAIKYAEQFAYSSEHQFDCIMKALGYEIIHSEKGKFDVMGFQGIGKNGKPSTKVITNDLVTETLRQSMNEAYKIANVKKSLKLKPNTHRVENLIKSCFEYSKSQSHLENMLKRHGVHMFVSYTSTGEPMGLTFVDMTTKTCLKGSQIYSLSITKMKEAVQGGKWRESDRGDRKDTIQGVSKEEVKNVTRILKEYSKMTNSTYGAADQIIDALVNNNISHHKEQLSKLLPIEIGNGHLLGDKNEDERDKTHDLNITDW